MADRYVFDKRDVKKQIKKYAIRFLIALPFVLLVEILTAHMHPWASLGLGARTCVVVLLVIALIAHLIQKGKEEKNTN